MSPRGDIASKSFPLPVAKKSEPARRPAFMDSREFISHPNRKARCLEPTHDFSVTRVWGTDEITEPPTAFETCVGDNCAVDVGDVFGEFEEPKARFAALLVCHYKDDAMTREQPALSREGIVIAKLP